MNVDEMLDQISWDQLQEWMAYGALEPFDEERADLRSAQVTAAIYNVNRGKGKQPVDPRNIVLKFGDAGKIKKTWQDLKAAGRAFVEAFKG